MKRFTSIGIPSAIFIVFLMCLTLFGLLCMNDAKRAAAYSEQYGRNVSEHYSAEERAYEFIASFDPSTDDYIFNTDGGIRDVSYIDGVLSFVTGINNTQELMCAYDFNTGKVTDWHTVSLDTGEEEEIHFLEVFD